MNDLELTTDIADIATDIAETDEPDEETLTSLLVQTIALTAASTITAMGVMIAATAVYEKVEDLFAARRLAKAEKIVFAAKMAEFWETFEVKPEVFD